MQGVRRPSCCAGADGAAVVDLFPPHPLNVHIAAWRSRSRRRGRYGGVSEGAGFMAPPVIRPHSVTSERLVPPCRRLVKSLATMMGAAALVVAPIRTSRPGCPGRPRPDAGRAARGAWSTTTRTTGYRRLEEDGFVNVVCIKVEGEEAHRPVPHPGELETRPRPMSLPWSRLAAPPRPTRSTRSRRPGHYLSHATSENSHHPLLGRGSRTTRAPRRRASRLAVVETDRVADTGSTTALGVFAAGAMIVGAGALFLSRHRQGAHR